jgi:sodium transport system permease protein
MIATVRTVLAKELREALRDRRTLVNSLLIGPILAPLFFVFVLKLALERSVAGEDERVPVTVVNAAGAPNLVQQLREREIGVTLREGTEADIRAWITAENALVVLRIPPGFGARFEAGKPAAVQLYADGSDSEAGKRAARLRDALAG